MMNPRAAILFLFYGRSSFIVHLYNAPGDPAKTPIAMRELSRLSPALMVSMPMEAARTILCRKMAPNETHTLLTVFCSMCTFISERLRETRNGGVHETSQRELHNALCPPWRLRAMPSMTAWKHNASMTKNVRMAERIFFSLIEVESRMLGNIGCS